MNRKVFLESKKKYDLGEMDILVYLRKYAEHLLCVKVQKYRQGKLCLADFIADLRRVVQENGDILVDV